MALEVKLIRYTPDPLWAMAEAASVCYDAEPSVDVVFKCIERGHTSILEFADFHFLVTGLSRATSHQLVRHRLASYAQRSQRYINESNFKYVIPHTIEKKPTAKRIYEEIMDSIALAYEQLIELGVPKEDARFVLPNATETQIHVKMNFRELLHFCEERLCTRAQWEIRNLAWRMVDEVYNVAPQLARYLRPKCVRLGYCPEQKPCGFAEIDIK